MSRHVIVFARFTVFNFGVLPVTIYEPYVSKFHIATESQYGSLSNATR